MSSSISQQLQTGLELHRSGRLQEAESYYKSVREQEPQHPDAWHLLGVLAHQVGNNERSVELVEEAIKRNPDIPDFYVTCGEAYRALHKYESAITCLREALKRNPEFAGAHLNIGNLYKDMGRTTEAEEHFAKAIKLQPGFAVAHNNLGVILKETDRNAEALNCFKKAIEIMPGNFEAHNNLGNTLFALNRVDEAIEQYGQALKLMPEYAEAHSNLGNALKEMGRPQEAIAHYERSIAIKPDFAMAHCNLGTALDDLGRPQEAIASYEQALAIQPDYTEAHNNLGNALDEMGRQEDAITHYEQAIAIKPDYAEAHRNLTRLRPKQEQAPVLEKLLETPSLSETDAIHCHFALGTIYDDSENYDKAFQHYNQGNILKRKTVTYASQSYTAYIDRLIEVYSKDCVQQINALGSDSELPVFIVGMPRSGTSLVEQIVSSHTEVYGAGELAALVDVEEAIADRFKASSPYPECMPLFNESDALDFAKQYLDQLEESSADTKRVTDKLPNNYLRIGLIKTLFPRARIIHCQRNAMDTCTSNFLNYFSFGNGYSFDLKELGRHYLDYERLMRHWQSVFSSEILTVKYEELVVNQEKVSRQLIEYIGLEWDDRCLDFHKSKRFVNTFSSSQVRKPVYTQSINRWKHYEQQLAPLSEILNGA